MGLKHAWQRFEQRIAKIFNTQRSSFSGSNSGVTSSDSYHDNLFIECKYHKNQAVLTLMKDTEEKARTEGKIPVVCLGDPEDKKKSMYVMFNTKHLLNIVREIDLHLVDQKIQSGTTIGKLLSTSQAGSLDLHALQEKINIELKQLVRRKVITNDGLDRMKNLSTLGYMIDTIIDYMREE